MHDLDRGEPREQVRPVGVVHRLPQCAAQRRGRSVRSAPPHAVHGRFGQGLPGPGQAGSRRVAQEIGDRVGPGPDFPGQLRRSQVEVFALGGGHCRTYLGGETSTGHPGCVGVDHQPRTEEGVERAVQSGGTQSGQRSGDLEFEVAAYGGQYPQQGERVGGHAHHGAVGPYGPRGPGCLDQLRNPIGVQRQVPGGEVVRDAAQHGRAAARHIGRDGGHFRADLTPRQCFQHLPGVGRGQGGQRDLPHRGETRVGQAVVLAEKTGERTVGGADQQDRGVVCAAGHRLEPAQRPCVGPLHVVHGEQQRTVGGERQELVAQQRHRGGEVAVAHTDGGQFDHP
nr:hypothetical protein [Streptomyces sp. RTd22]